MTAQMHGGVPPAVEQRRDVVEHGHQGERQPDLERVRHPPRVVPGGLGQLRPERDERAPDLVQRRPEQLPAACHEAAVAALGDAAIVALGPLRRLHRSSLTELHVQVAKLWALGEHTRMWNGWRMRTYI